VQVLLVESDPVRLARLQQFLTESGLEVTVADDGQEALRIHEESGPPLVVAADDLPTVDGLELCRRIRERVGDHTYVLLLVGRQMETDLDDVLEAGADDVLIRPVHLDELRLRLQLARRRILKPYRSGAAERPFVDSVPNAPDLIQTVDLDGKVLYVNAAWCEELGYGEGELTGNSLFDLIAPDVLQPFRKAFRWVKRGRGIRHMQTALVTRSGEVMRVEGSLMPRFRGKSPTSVRVLFRDVSRRKHAETVLHNVLHGTSATTGTEFFRSLVQHLSTALEVRHALVGAFVPNEAARLRTLAEWKGEAFLPERDLELDDMPSLGAGEDAGFFPGARFLAEAGAESYLGVPLVGSAGEPIGLLCVLDGERVRAGPSALRILSTFARRAGAELQRLRVEAERRELDRRMQESQKLESLGVLAGGIAHDFNNLLTSIMGYASLARGSAPPGSPATRYLGDIETASRRAADLATQMLAYSGKGRFVIQPLDLREIVRETIGFLRTDLTGRGVSLEIDAPEALSAVEGDATQVRQVLMNLLLNAAQSMEPRGGAVRTRVWEGRVQSGDLCDCYVGADLPDGRYVSVVIEDSGCGMDARTAPRIFDPFFTTKEGGRGLGLAAVVGIMRGHDGALRVKSEPGVGTTVSVFFPASDKPVPVAPNGDGVIPPQGAGLVLVVDDEEGVRNLTTEILRSGGYRVLTASDGREGLELFRKRSAEIRAVLLDMTMPVMGGVEAFRRMRDNRPDVPVVFSSGFTEVEAVNRLGGDVPSEFIQKPYTASELLDVLGRAVAGRTSVS